MQHTLFVHFFAVTTRQPSEIAQFHVRLVGTQIGQIFLFPVLLDLDDLRNWTPGEIAYIWRSKGVGIIAINTEGPSLHFFAAVAVLGSWGPYFEITGLGLAHPVCFLHMKLNCRASLRKATKIIRRILWYDLQFVFSLKSISHKIIFIWFSIL